MIKIPLNKVSLVSLEDITGQVIFWQSLEDFLRFASERQNTACSKQVKKRSLATNEWMRSNFRNEHYVRLAVEKVHFEAFLRGKMANVTFRLDSKVFFFLEDGEELILYETYAKSALPTSSSTRIQRVFDIADPMEGIWNRRRDLTGVHLRAAYNTFNFMAMQKEGEVYGFYPDIFEALRNATNFTYSLQFSVDGTHGKKTV